MLATLMQVLDSTIANVALPYMQGSLGASQDQINWVLTSYIVAAAIMTPVTGWLTGRFGRTRLFLWTIIGFTVASVLCGLAQNLGEIVLFRLLQGLCGAPLVPLSQAVLLDIYPREKQGQALAIWSVGVMVGPVLGPVLGGWLTDQWDWRWVFYVNVPIGILTWFGLTIFLEESPRNLGSRFDWFGFAMLGLGVGAFQMMLDRGEQLDWFAAPEIVIEAGVAAIGIWCFVVHLLWAKQPLISLSLFRDRNFLMANIFIFVIGIMMYSTMSLLTPFLQDLTRTPVIPAGSILAPRGAGMVCSLLMAGRMVDRMDARLPIFFGFSIAAYSLWVMTGFTADTPQWNIMMAGVEQGFGIGFITAPLSVVGFSTLPPALRGQGTGFFSLIRNVGSAVGISLMISQLQRETRQNHADISALVTPFNRLFQSGTGARFLDPQHPASAALLDGLIDRQANAIGYLDDFKTMMVLALLSMPLVLLLKPRRRVAAAAAE